MSDQLESLRRSGRARADRHWQPSFDLYRAGRGWLIKLDVAGVQAGDVEIHLEASAVVVRGIRRDQTIQDGHVPYRMEIAYSRFERTIPLPESPGREPPIVVEDRGMLLIRLLGQGEEP